MGGGHANAFHQLFGEGLAAFELRRCCGRTEGLETVCLEAVDDAAGQGIVGADDGQADVALFGEGDQAVDFGAELIALGYGRIDADVDQFGQIRHAGVAGGDVEFVDARALRQLPHQGVFAPSLADDQCVHRGSLLDVGVGGEFPSGNRLYI